MYIGMLGDLIVGSPEANLAPSAPKVRKVLATLVVNAGTPVSSESLMRELWESNPPRSASTTLQTYILTLRRCLADTEGVSMSCIARDRLRTHPGGYTLRLDAALSDVGRFRTFSTRARTTLAEGDEHTASVLFRQALGEWRGPALGDIPTGSVLDARRIELEESRLLTTEMSIGTDLRLGRSREVLPDLMFLVAMHPLHEGLHAQHMKALYMCGRRAQALEVFARLREQMIQELGIEPGMELQRLRTAILNSDRDNYPAALIGDDSYQHAE